VVGTRLGKQPGLSALTSLLVHPRAPLPAGPLLAWCEPPQMEARAPSRQGSLTSATLPTARSRRGVHESGDQPCGSFCFLRPWYRLAPWALWPRAQTNNTPTEAPIFLKFNQRGDLRCRHSDGKTPTTFAPSTTIYWANCSARMIYSYPVLCQRWSQISEHCWRYSAIDAVICTPWG
jgi:hypothetical protein